MNTYTALFNNQPFHAAPIALNLMNMALINANNAVQKAIEVSNHPLPLSQLDEIDEIGGAASAGFQIGFTTAFG